MLEAEMLALPLAPACSLASDMLMMLGSVLATVCVTEEGCSILQSLSFEKQQCFAG